MRARPAHTPPARGCAPCLSSRVRVRLAWLPQADCVSASGAGIHGSEAALRAAIAAGEAEVAPSTLFALAAIDEGCPFINGSPQNTFVPGVIEAAVRTNTVIAGDDFKSGQTKMKSVLVDFLVRPTPAECAPPFPPQSEDRDP